MILLEKNGNQQRKACKILTESEVAYESIQTEKKRDERSIKAQCYVESRMGFSSGRNKAPTYNIERDVMQCLDVRNYNIYDYLGIDVKKYYVITSKKEYITGEKMWDINLGKEGYPPPLAGVYNSEKYGRCGGIVRILFTTEKNGGGEYYYEGSDKNYYFHLEGVNPMMSIAIGVDTMHQNLESCGGNQQEALYLYNKGGDSEYISKVEAIVNAEGTYQGE